MLWSLYTLACVLTCVSAVTQLTQNPPVVTKNRGQSAYMDCNLGYVEDRNVWWYKQSPGQVPQFLLHHYHSYSSSTYGSGVSSSKFSCTHQSKKDYRLTINSLEKGDAAVYYCSTWDDTSLLFLSSPHSSIMVPSVLLVSTSGLIWTRGTLMKARVHKLKHCGIRSRHQALSHSGHSVPSVPAQLQSHTVTLLCVSSQSGPFAQVSWLVDGSPVSSGVWSSGAVLGEENTFHMSSSLSIPTSHWNTGQQLYTCRVSLGPQTQTQDTIRSGVCGSD
ncbi:hypothetical protein WMY93_025594 [Mugilogobius chulae]|uniref:Ig-like domain-containing protein n=1 Tax=Mugilogobius chulae TaxID=88201 RepID=A0AAW0N490_9GOBI